jgi:hypothetical protein
MGEVRNACKILFGNFNIRYILAVPQVDGGDNIRRDLKKKLQLDGAE